MITDTLIDQIKNEQFEVLVIGGTIYEYEIAQFLGIPFIQIVSNPFSQLQLFNDVLSPQNSMSTTFLSQFYPSLLTRFSIVGRFVNHICIL